MLITLTVAALLGLSMAAPEREKRQIPGNNACPDTFQLTFNPCQSSQGRIYYPVQGDASKFVQCDVLGRAYVVQCPTGLEYNQATTSCQYPQPPTQAPVLDIPCTGLGVQQGQTYLPYPGDNTKFYECSDIGQAQVLQCPNGLVWDSGRVACVYAAGSNPGVQTTVFPTSQSFINPCTIQQLASNHYYFAHPEPTKFIQCDNAGEAFVVSCPSGLIWNQYYEVCSFAFVGTQPAIG